ncbi:interleukin-2 receptor subunit beta isoform 2-T2 [Pholidichthys leucotaenia]
MWRCYCSCASQLLCVQQMLLTKFHMIFTVDKMPNISLECNGTLVEYLTDYDPAKHIKMHPPGLPNVTISANHTFISWSPGSPCSIFLEFFDFEIHIKEHKQTWEEAITFSTQEKKLRISAQQLKGNLQVRVRVKPSDISYRENSTWSDWSPAASWVEATQMEDTSENQGGEDRSPGQRSYCGGGPGGCGRADVQENPTVFIKIGVGLIPCFLLPVILAIYRSYKTTGVLSGKELPNPSEYFKTLHTAYEGNLKKWLNPLPVSESFFTAQLCDEISAVKVVPTSPSCSSIDAPMNFQSYPSGSDTSGVVDDDSCFSNMGHFTSSSSGISAQIDPGPAYFTYNDDFHGLHPSLDLLLSTSPAYDSLKREPQSPDSGFIVIMEDEAGELFFSDQHSPFLNLPLQPPSSMCPPAPPQTPPQLLTVTQTPSDIEQVDIFVAGSGSGSSAAWSAAVPMSRSSSMPVEPSKTGYVTLKELHATFSNKSI